MESGGHTLICPHCGNELHIDELMESSLNDSMREKRRMEINEALKHQKDVLEADYRKRVDKEVEDAIQRSNDTISQLHMELEMFRKRGDDAANMNDEAQRTIIELKKKLMDKEMEMKRKLSDSIEEIYGKAKEDAERDNEGRTQALMKKIQDITKINNELRQRLEQGSQQLQGEVSELRLEDCLRSEFVYDTIEEVPKGRSGADIVQTVIGSSGRVCGRIVWESKNVKQWSNDFIPKLRGDMDLEKGDVAILVSNVFGRNMTEFSLVDGIWLVKPMNAMSMARLIRDSLVRISETKSIVERRDTIQDEVFEFFTSPSFRNRMVTIGQKYRALEREIVRTKDSMERHWRAQRKLIDELVGSTNEILGDMDSVVALAEGVGTGVLTDGGNEE